MNIFEFSVLIIILAFLCEYIDSSLGMGYGTTLTPLLLIMGYQPLQIVPAVLLSELITGLGAGFFHHKAKNVNLKIGTTDFKISMVMAGCSVFGTIFAVLLAVKVSTFYIKLYIGILVLTMGILIFGTLRKTFSFSWKKIISLGLLAAFNKGISGGGYGPLVTSGQILSGVNSKNAIGVTSLAEGLTCLVGVIAYIFYTNHTIQWTLAPSLIVGAILSVPFAAFTVKKVKAHHLRLIVGIATLVLGLFTLGKIIF
jgi:uncharacterized membrane protein YfcA